MNAVTFDTLKFVEHLKAAGVSDAHAKAEAEALLDAMGSMELATKADLREMEARLLGEMNAVRGDMNAVRGDMNILMGELKLVKWMLAIVIVVNVAPVLKAMF